MGYNKAQVIGFLGKDPELRYTQTGEPVANFSVATSEKWTGNDGQAHEKTEWHRIVAWGKLAENCKKYIQKGSQVFVEGKLQTREWEKDGVKRYSTEIVAFTVQFLDRKESSEKDQIERGKQEQAEQEVVSSHADDDVPF